MESVHVRSRWCPAAWKRFFSTRLCMLACAKNRRAVHQNRLHEGFDATNFVQLRHMHNMHRQYAPCRKGSAACEPPARAKRPAQELAASSEPTPASSRHPPDGRPAPDARQRRPPASHRRHEVPGAEPAICINIKYIYIYIYMYKNI